MGSGLSGPSEGAKLLEQAVMADRLPQMPDRLSPLTALRVQPERRTPGLSPGLVCLVLPHA